MSESLQLFEGCLAEFTMRSCVYNTTVNNAMPVSGRILDHQRLKGRAVEKYIADIEGVCMSVTWHVLKFG